MNRFAVQDADPQIAILWDIFGGEDRLLHKAFLGLDLKVRFDLPQLRLKVFRGPLSPMEDKALAPICQARERKTLPPPACADYG